MKRKDYMKPTMRFVYLQNRRPLLRGSIPSPTDPEGVELQEMGDVEDL